MGYRVTVFEAYPKLGGTMQVGIPLYRLPREVIDIETTPLKDLGIEFVPDQRITDVDLGAGERRQFRLEQWLKRRR